MHPILFRLRNLGLYLLAWIPVAGMLVHSLTRPGGLSWTEAIAVTVPLCLVYAFVCLAAGIRVEPRPSKNQASPAWY